jgi:hypothetical protein
VPLTVLNNHYVWIKKGVTLKNKEYSLPQTFPIDNIKTYELKNLPYLLGKNQLDENNEKLMEWEGDKILLSDTLKIGREVKKSNGNKLEILVDNRGNECLATLTYMEKNKVLGTFTFLIHAQTLNQKYIIPVSSQYNWHKNNPDAFSLTIQAEQARLKKALLVHGGL